jgi:hypothetical protein
MKRDVRDGLAGRGTILKEWKDGKDDLYIWKDGDRISLVRVYVPYNPYGASQANSEIKYSADQVTHACFTGTNGTIPIDCKDVARHPEMRPYVKWVKTTGDE